MRAAKWRKNTHFSCVLRKGRQKFCFLPREFLGRSIKGQNLIRSETGNEITGAIELYHKPVSGSLALMEGALMKYELI